MCERADRDHIDAALCNRAHRLEIDATGGLALHAAANHSHGFAQHRRVHIVEEHNISAFRDDFAQLIKRIDFNLNFHEMADGRFRRAQRWHDAARNSNVIILDQHRIIEAKPMIGATAAFHSVFFSCA